jgi:hypothetical protein
MNQEGPKYTIDPTSHAIVESYIVDGKRISFNGYQKDLGYGSLSIRSLHDDLSLAIAPPRLSITARPEEDSNMSIQALYKNGCCLQGTIHRFGYSFLGPSFIYGFTITLDMKIAPYIQDTNTQQLYDPKTFKHTKYIAVGNDEWEIRTEMTPSTIHLIRQGMVWQITGGEMITPISINLQATEQPVGQTLRALRLLSSGRIGIHAVTPVLKELLQGFVGEKGSIE